MDLPTLFAEGMAEAGTGALGDERFYPPPLPILVSNSLTETANWQHPLEYLDLALLLHDLMNGHRETAQHNHVDERVRPFQRPRGLKLPVQEKRQPQQRQQDRDCQSADQSLRRRGDRYRNNEKNGELNKGTCHVVEQQDEGGCNHPVLHSCMSDQFEWLHQSSQRVVKQELLGSRSDFPRRVSTAENQPPS